MHQFEKKFELKMLESAGSQKKKMKKMMEEEEKPKMKLLDIADCKREDTLMKMMMKK